MIRLIDANALKTALYYDVSKGTYGEFMDGSEVSLTDREILQLIDEQPTIDAEPHWIPCSERLPEEKGEYLVTYHPCYWDDVKDEIRVGIDTFRGRTTWAKKKHQRVIAWMPLPKPYEVKE